MCLLAKGLYGLKQSQRAWYNTINSSLTQVQQFSQTLADSNVYIKREGESYVILALYVDNAILFSNNLDLLKHTKKILSQQFEMKDYGEVHYCLGIQVVCNRENRTIYLNQQRNIEDILERFNMKNCKPSITPMEANIKLSKDMCPRTSEERKFMANIPYRSAVGCLVYAMVCTRPDIAFAVGTVSQFLEDPGVKHWSVVKRIMRYLHGTATHGISYSPSINEKDTQVIGYCDSDWAGDVDSRKSTTGYCFLLGQGAISWHSKKQPIVALSSTEAEYVASTNATKEAIWLQQLCKDVGFKQFKPTIIYCDNQSCIALTQNSKFHTRTKHVEIHHHFIREKVLKGDVEIKYCNAEEQYADFLTKSSPRPKHELCKLKLGVTSTQRE